MKDRFAGAFRDVGRRHKGKRIGTLWIDCEESTGDATLTADFLDMQALERADVLLDIIGVLQAEYELAVSLIFADTQ